MTDKAQVVAATMVGAVAGGLAGYMFFTGRGRALRRAARAGARGLRARAQPVSAARSTEAPGVASEGWKLLNEALGEAAARPPRYVDPHQTSPF